MFKLCVNNSYKGSYGDVIVVGGVCGMVGVLVLVVCIVVFGGVGWVYVVFVDDGLVYDDKYFELMFCLVDCVEFGVSVVLVIGFGLGILCYVYDILVWVFDSEVDIVVDVDVLNLILVEFML